VTTAPPAAPAATPTAGPAGDHAAGARGDWALVALMLALYAPLLFFGYGSDNDTYLVLDSGRGLLRDHTYTPSRNPGYFLYELTTGVLSRFGGSVLCNAATLAMAVVSLLCFLKICRRLDVPRPHLLGLLLVVHPVFWVNGTCTMEYVWALALLLAGALLVIKRSYWPAAVLLGLAIAVRSTSFIAAGLVLGYALLARRPDRGRVVLAGVVAVVLGGLFYLPPFIHAGYSPAFLKPMIGTSELWTLKLRLARFVYKNLYFWGLIGSLALPVLLLLGSRRLLDPARRPLVLGCAGVVAAHEALFLRFPIELGYLLPMLPAVLILLGVGLAHRPAAILVFGALLLSYAGVNVNIARPDQHDRATGGSVGLWVEPGYVVQEARKRLALRGCDSYDCWVAVMKEDGR
jgi:hypothetical protein